MQVSCYVSRVSKQTGVNCTGGEGYNLFYCYLAEYSIWYELSHNNDCNKK